METINSEENKFYEIKIRDINFRILKRYTNVNYLASGSQGIVL